MGNITSIQKYPSEVKVFKTSQVQVPELDPNVKHLLSIEDVFDITEDTDRKTIVGEIDLLTQYGNWSAGTWSFTDTYHDKIDNLYLSANGPHIYRDVKTYGSWPPELTENEQHNIRTLCYINNYYYLGIPSMNPYMKPHPIEYRIK